MNTPKTPLSALQFRAEFDPPHVGEIGTAYDYKAGNPVRLFIRNTQVRLSLAMVEKLRRELAVVAERHCEWLRGHARPLIRWEAIARYDTRWHRDGWIARLQHIGNEGVYEIARRNHAVIVFRIAGGVWTTAATWQDAVEVCELHARIEQQKLIAAGGSPVPEQRPGASETPPPVARAS